MLLKPRVLRPLSASVCHLISTRFNLLSFGYRFQFPNAFPYIIKVHVDANFIEIATIDDAGVRFVRLLYILSPLIARESI